MSTLAETDAYFFEADEIGDVAGSPWRLAMRRLRRNRSAIVAGVAFILVVLSAVLAPVYADHIARTRPFSATPNATTVVNGKTVQVIQAGGGVLKLGETPIGPTWKHNYFLGADTLGRDVMARLLYAGRSSLIIGIGSGLLCAFLATLVGLAAGFFGGVDRQHPLAGRWT